MIKIFIFLFLCILFINGQSQTTIFASGFEAGQPALTFDGTQVPANVTTSPYMGSRHARISGGCSGGSAGCYSGSIITPSAYTFVPGCVYTITVYARASGCRDVSALGGVRFRKAVANTHADMTSASGSDIIGGSIANFTNYAVITANFTVSSSETMYIGIWLYHSGGGGCAGSSLDIDNLLITSSCSQCEDGTQNGSETSIDCGGSTCVSAAPVGGAISISPGTTSYACGSAGSILFSLTGYTGFINWQYSDDGGTFWYDIPNENFINYSTSVPYSTTSYRVKTINDGCTPRPAYSNVITITITGITAKTWLTSGTTAWGTASNWSPAGVPSACNDVTIPSGGVQPTITAAANCRNLTVNSGANLTVSQTLNIYGNLINNGNMNDAAGYIDLYGMANTWGGTGTYLSGATQQGWIRIRNGANYRMINNITVQRINPSCLTSTGHLSIGSYTLLLTTQLCNTFYLHYNTGIVEINGGGSIDVSKSDYGTGTLHVNWSGVACGGAASLANCVFDLEDDYYNVWFSCDAGTYIKFGNAALDVQVKNDHWIKTGGLSHVKAGSNDVKVGGDWINDGDFEGGTAVVELNGDATTPGIQEIKGTSVTTFNGLTINNSTLSGVTMQIDAGTNNSSTGILNLVQNGLFLNSNRFTVQYPSIAAITRTNGYVVSETNSSVNPSILQWNINASTGSHVFPFGSSTGEYIPVTFNNSGNVGNVAISTRPTPSDNTPITGASNVSAVSSMACDLDLTGCEIESVIDRWWDITSSLASPLPAVTLSLTYRGSENATTTAGGNVAFQHWTGSSWNDGQGGISGTYIDAGTTGVTSGTQTVTQGGFIQFSPYVLIRLGGGFPLPVELISFNSLCYHNKVDLLWSTASEKNSDYFEVEKSSDGLNFTPFTRVASAGNSNTVQTYTAVDFSPFTGNNYYRLHQFDFDGKDSYSEIITSDCNNISVIEDISPVNSFEKNLEFILSGIPGKTYKLNISNIIGQVLAGREIVLTENRQNVKFDNLNLSNGIYYVVLHAESYLTCKPVVVCNK